MPASGPLHSWPGDLIEIGYAPQGCTYYGIRPVDVPANEQCTDTHIAICALPQAQSRPVLRISVESTGFEPAISLLPKQAG